MTIALLAALLVLVGCAGLPTPTDRLGANTANAFAFKLDTGETLSADLKFPPAGEPRALVVVLHGGSGIAPLDTSDARVLQDAGYATLIVDSFTGRGFQPPQGSGAGWAMSPAIRVPEVFAATRVALTHPRLAGKRAVVLGRSHGGAVGLIAATRWAQQRYASAGPSFAGFIVTYPACSARFPELAQTTGPIRMHLGEQDDLTPASQCVALGTWMKSSGADMRWSTYPDAHHAFDAEYPVTRFPGFRSGRNCNFVLPSVTSVPSASELNACTQLGAHIGGNSAATRALRSQYLAEIQELIR